MKPGNMIVTIIVMIIIAGCHTSTSFMLPPNTSLMINDERVSFDSKDEAGRPKLELRPFFWTSIMGVKYTLVQDDKIIKEDKLPSKFRIVSIFWPPYAYIYWPFGFSFDCYDLTNIKKEFVEKCPEQNEIMKGNVQTSQLPVK